MAEISDGKCNVSIPPLELLINPTLEALRELGGTDKKARVSAIVYAKMQLTREQLDLRYPSGGNRIENRMNDVRLYLLREGLIVQPQVGTWQLTERGWAEHEHNFNGVKSVAARKQKQRTQREHLVPFKYKMASAESVLSLDDLIQNHNNWRDQLLDQLYEMSAMQLERFFLRIFKDEGINEVGVIGSVGGTEIQGTMSSGGFLTFRIFFNVIRGSLQISAPKVEDFRRQAQVSGVDKGLLITTGTFTQEAIREASKGGSPKIELIDGEQLLDKLKELGLGVSTRRVLVEQVIIDPDFFANIGSGEL